MINQRLILYCNLHVIGGIPSCQNVKGFWGKCTSFWQVKESLKFLLMHYKPLRSDASEGWDMLFQMAGFVCTNVWFSKAANCLGSFFKLLLDCLCLWVLCWKVWRKCKIVKYYVKFKTKITASLHWGIYICRLLYKSKICIYILFLPWRSSFTALWF